MGLINKSTDEINELLDKVENMPEEGATGKTPVLETGATTTLEPGKNATSEVVANGTDSSGNPKYKINFGIPRGYDGSSTGGGGVADSVQWSAVLNKPTWVNSSTKPTYTATEVGALPASTTIPSRTSQLTNDSKYVTSSKLKTINGQSIVGDGNIEISGTGSGIADAPSDGKTYGRKNGNWSAIQGTDSVDVSEIYNRLIQLSGVRGAVTDSDYNTLVGYAQSGTVCYVNIEGLCSNLQIIINDDSINIKLSVIQDTVLESQKTSIYVAQTLLINGSDKKVSAFAYQSYDAQKYGFGQLGAYTKPASYSQISPTDTISQAIGKLDAGLSSVGGGGNVYELPDTILKLTSDSTKDEVLEAFGGADKMNKFIDEIFINGKDVYIKNRSQSATTSVPVSLYGLYLGNYFLVLSFEDLDAILDHKTYNCKLIRLSYSKSSSTITSFYIQKIYSGGYGLNSSFYGLDSSSDSETISLAIGGEYGMQNLIQALEDGNRIYIKGGTDFPGRTDINCNSYSKSDNGNMNVVLAGMGYALWGCNLGCLVIDYIKSSNTFIATVIPLIE